jgi:hypothetical protein
MIAYAGAKESPYMKIIAAIVFSLAAACAFAQDAAPENVAEQIVVVGQKPGPGLWKVSKGDHVLWVFGSYSPLPKKMEWRAREVESILAESQEYLQPPNARADVGFFKSLTLLPQMIGLKKNPDGAELKDVLPPEVHARWLELKKKYIGEDSGIERERPLFAAGELHRRALDKIGLGSDRDVRERIEKIVKQHKIRTTKTEIQLALDDPSRLLKEFKKSPLEDVDCFRKTLDHLEGDLDSLRVRANAWAVGDIEAIRKLNFAERDISCRDAVFNSQFMKEQASFRLMEERMRDSWLNAAERALAANRSTFAMLQLKDIVDAKGYLAALEARGYSVQKPE